MTTYSKITTTSPNYVLPDVIDSRDDVKSDVTLETFCMQRMLSNNLNSQATPFQSINLTTLDDGWTRMMSMDLPL